MEPILLRYATTNGTLAMFNTTFLDFKQDENGVTTTIKNVLTGHTSQVRSKYLFGCDGGRSPVSSRLDLTWDKRPSGGVAYNVLLNADLNDYMEHTEAQLHLLMQPELDPKYGAGPILRMVKPWKQWLLVLFPQPGTNITPLEQSPESSQELISYVRQAIGDDTVEIEILGVSKWAINETVAAEYSKSRV